MPEFRTITIGHAAEETLMCKAQQPVGYVDEFDLEQLGSNGWYATLWRHGGDSPSGEKRIALFSDPSEELELLRGRVAMLEKYEPEFLRLIREAEAERDILKALNATFVDLLETSSHFLYDWGRRDGKAHAEEIDAALQEARAEVVHGEPSDIAVLLDYLASKIVGKTISVDMSTGDHDVGNRIFCSVADVMREGDGFSILAEDPKPNYSAVDDLLQAQSAIREFIRIDGISVDGSSARNKALIALASFASALDGNLKDRPAVAVRTDALPKVAGEVEVARLHREVEQLHASAETVNEVLVRCRQERNSLRTQVGMALSLAQAAELSEPHAGFGQIVDALSATPMSADAVSPGNSNVLRRHSGVEHDQIQAELKDLIGLQIGLLDWNRAQPTPLITPGYEYGVAAVVYEMLQPERVGTSAPSAGSDVSPE